MRPTLVASIAATAALLGAAPAQADSPNDSGSGTISATIEKFGQSICPSLVKPGSSLATTVSELQGNTGLTPTLTGMVAGLVIQTQCPTVMTQIANGDLSALTLPGQETPGQETSTQDVSGLDLSDLDLSGLNLSALLQPAGR